MTVQRKELKKKITRAELNETENYLKKIEERNVIGE